MYSVVLVLLVATAVNAGHLALGVGYNNYGRVLGTGSGSTVSQQSTSTSIANSAIAPVTISSAPAVALAAPPVAVLSAAPLAVAAHPVVSIPTATSSQSRVDVINSRPLVSQVVSSVPVNLAVSGGVGAGYDYGYGNGLVASAGLVTGNVNSAYGANAHSPRSY
ncbi:larval cuticle protein F1-like [Diorhabda carinulata]|uniref:larval cuticle protein F1-like n=1 Tax=Diorhabda carinulata TaxID=1163345 RepID=UPI0025A0A0BB|nr:larval cuticle protein F1-like [Diorhabda carinulata]